MIDFAGQQINLVGAKPEGGPGHRASVSNESRNRRISFDGAFLNFVDLIIKPNDDAT